MDHPRPLFHLFSSFQTNITTFTTNKCQKCPSSLWCWDSNPQPSEHESLVMRGLLLCFSSQEYHFTEMFKNQPSKIAAVIFNAVLTVVGTYFQHNFAIYEQYKANRTLINQLISSFAAVINFPNLTIQFLFIIHYSLAPLPAFICHLDVIVRLAFAVMYVLFLDAITIVRYMFIFHTKNPTAMQEDFWKIFLTIWMARDNIVNFNPIISP